MRTSSLASPNAFRIASAMSYSKPDFTCVGSESLPSQKPGPGRLVTTVSVSALIGVKSLALVTSFEVRVGRAAATATAGGSRGRTTGARAVVVVAATARGHADA